MHVCVGYMQCDGFDFNQNASDTQEKKSTIRRIKVGNYLLCAIQIRAAFYDLCMNGLNGKKNVVSNVWVYVFVDNFTI
jgi:hypothetical protein